MIIRQRFGNIHGRLTVAGRQPLDLFLEFVDILKAEGVDIARRTVAKYREALNIPSSVQRRKVKKNQAKS